MRTSLIRLAINDSKKENALNSVDQSDAPRFLYAESAAQDSCDDQKSRIEVHCELFGQNVR